MTVTQESTIFVTYSTVKYVGESTKMYFEVLFPHIIFLWVSGTNFVGVRHIFGLWVSGLIFVGLSTEIFKSNGSETKFDPIPLEVIMSNYGRYKILTAHG